MKKFLLDCAELGSIITYCFIALGLAAYHSYGLITVCGIGVFFAVVSFVEKCKMESQLLRLTNPYKVKLPEQRPYADPKSITFAELKARSTKPDPSIARWKVYEAANRKATTEKFLTPASLESLTDKLATATDQEGEHILRCLREEIECKRTIIEQAKKK